MVVAATLSGPAMAALATVWGVMLALLMACAFFFPTKVYWGRIGGQVPMSAISRVLIVSTVWLMIGMVLVGVTGIAPVNHVAGLWLAGVALTFVSSMVDVREWKRNQK